MIKTAYMIKTTNPGADAPTTTLYTDREAAEAAYHACDNGNIKTVVLSGNHIPHLHGASYATLGYWDIAVVEAGTVYEDPEGIWEIVGITEDTVNIECIQEGNINLGKRFVVPIEEAVYFIGESK